MARYGSWLAAVGILAASTEVSAQKADRWAGEAVMLREEGVRPGRIVGGHLFRGDKRLDANEVFSVARSRDGYLELEAVDGWVTPADVVRAGGPAVAFFTRKIREEPAAGKWYGRRALAAGMAFKGTSSETGQVRISAVPSASALADLNEAIRLAPDESYWRVELGSFYLATGALAKAEEQYTAAIRMAPNRAHWHHYRAIFWFARHEFGKAIDDVNRAIELDPAESRQYFTRSSARIMLGQHEDGLRDLDRAVELRPANQEAIFQRAVLRLNTGNSAGGVADLGRLLEVNPLHQEARLWRTVARVKSGDYREALADYRQIQAMYPTVPDAYWREAHVLATAKDAGVRDGQRALALARVALVYAGAEAGPRVYNTLAEAHAEVGEFEEAVVAQTKANALIEAAGPGEEDKIANGVHRLSCYRRKEACRD